MTDIDDAVARGFRYPRFGEVWEDELDDDYDEVPPAPPALDRGRRVSLRQAIDAGRAGVSGQPERFQVAHPAVWNHPSASVSTTVDDPQSSATFVPVRELRSAWRQAGSAVRPVV